MTVAVVGKRHLTHQPSRLLARADAWLAGNPWGALFLTTAGPGVAVAMAALLLARR